ncbi:C-type lectin domain family 4 member E isoform X2 [Scophthalmus maximus]|uniref:C-type lectin domain family 4 member E isoform X2 n=1 Tax=Scophthalmus maximus TaxID=52904 RepID=UPI001FA8B1AF|nr:C-type lectin domain family 4 member E isoform X2 [Scophthalmus maximus]
MEYQFHQFGESDNGPVHGEHKITAKPVSQLNKEITEVKVHLERISHGGKTSASSAAEGEKTVEEVFLQKLAPVRGTCGNGWSSFQRSCYLLSTSPVTWSKAEEQCRAHGGHLLVVNNVEELDFISKIVELRYSYWIGLVEREHEGHWSWVDGTDFHSTPTFWDKGQPDNWDYRENGEDCGQLHASERRKRKMWNDADCSLWYQYICEAVVPL